MSFDIRLPNINSPTPEGQIAQIKSYLYQLTDQLKYASDSIEKQSVSAAINSVQQSASSGDTAQEAQNTFNSIKSLIIKSADIVEAYYEEINKRLEGIYVAESDFGVYAEQTANDISANSTAIEQFYTNLQQIISDIEGVENTLIEVNAHIKSGLLYYGDDGSPVYGLEIGQRTEIDGVETFNKYARFTSDRLSFFDSNDNEVAYISDKKLYINNVEVTGSYKIGGLVDEVLADLSVVTKYIGYGGEG